ncbi:zinc ABC transporter substrate-binding protein AdcA [Streptococcus plurextorum]|uniref:zinc ABC transporter substrate-binding protein AdcA n=1 Tax=Streptococcus plurextorum TaxID=456876 RepID=UPI0003F94F7E|nr:zinc ABC transporter substrate-binding protein AdcA [Streptococcus plurextorum]
MKRKKLGVFALILTLIIGVVIFWNVKNPSEKSSDKIQVVATFYPVYEFSKAVLGDSGEVELLVKAGTEVHDFEPSTKDLTTIQSADVFVYMDDNMETWVPHLAESIDTQKVNIIEMTGEMLLLAGDEEAHDHDHEEEGHHHAYDPHVWLSPARAISLVNVIKRDLSQAYPDKADLFEKNASAYIEKLKALDANYSQVLSAAKQKSFVTQHAAFSYLALDYGLDQISITGVSVSQEPTAQRLAELATYVKEQGINYIYFEENASAVVSETLAKEAGVKTAVLNPLESLTQKQLDAGEDYFSIMESNLVALQLTTEKEGAAIVAEETPEKTVYQGYFDDADIADRELSDWSGKWQSVYLLLLDGSLDQVWDYKAQKSKGQMSFAEYQEYYTTGYQTDVDAITIDGEKNTMSFTQAGQTKTFTYKYVGYKILTYQKGNRGVRFLFETDDKDAGDFKYVQFSDHIIAPEKSGHFHIYFGGTSQEELLNELENWPTYYPDTLTAHEIAQEMVTH